MASGQAAERPPDDVSARIAAGAFLLVDKPRGPTSHQVTAWVRDLLGVERAGHAGTLDPNVSGLLWIGVGPALKLLPLILEFPKRYVGVVLLHGKADPRAIARVLHEFEGAVYQTPPVRSAVRRERRVRRIHRLTLVESSATALLIDVVADSGTYIRTLAVDVGEALGVEAHLAELRRVGTGPFTEAQSVHLAEIADAKVAADTGRPEALAALLHPIREVWAEFPALVLKDAAVSAVAHGADLARGGILSSSRPFTRGARVALVDRQGDLVATGRALYDYDKFGGVKEGWVVDADRVFVAPERFPPTWHKDAAHRPTPSEPTTGADADLK
jgi:predicted rRNA pseudouridine synthase